jgi:hypothetical protein
MWPIWMLIPDLAGRPEDADEVGRALIAAYGAGRDARGLERPEAYRHAPSIPAKTLDAWCYANHQSEAVIGAFLKELASTPAGAQLTAAEVLGRWEEMGRAAAQRTV